MICAVLQGCSRGRHSNQKPQEPLRPTVTSDKGDLQNHNNKDIIYTGPKSAEALQKERPRCPVCLSVSSRPHVFHFVAKLQFFLMVSWCPTSLDETKTKLVVKVSTSLAQVLEKLQLTQKAEAQKQGERASALNYLCLSPSSGQMPVLRLSPTLFTRPFSPSSALSLFLSPPQRARLSCSEHGARMQDAKQWVIFMHAVLCLYGGQL